MKFSARSVNDAGPQWVQEFRTAKRVSPLGPAIGSMRRRRKGESGSGRIVELEFQGAPAP